jgi:hypothetical protein
MRLLTEELGVRVDHDVLYQSSRCRTITLRVRAQDTGKSGQIRPEFPSDINSL